MRLVTIMLAVLPGCALMNPKPAPLDPAVVRRTSAGPHVHDCLLSGDVSKKLSAAKDCHDLPIVENARVRRWIRVYQTQGRTDMLGRLARSGRHLYDMRTELAVSGLPEDLSYLPFVVTNFSTDGAGPWNLGKQTARRHGAAPDWWTDPRRDIDMSTRAAASYLKELHRKYRDWHLTIAAYTSGPSNVDRAIRKAGVRNYWKLAGYLPRAHRDDVPKILAAALIARHPEAFGFENVQYDSRWRYDAVTTSKAVSLRDVAELAKVTVDELARLNPALTRGCTPPNSSWDLRLPAGKADAVAAGIWDLAQAHTCTQHVVRKGETLTGIAAHYKMRRTALLSMNSMRSGQTLRVGTRLSVRVAVVIEDPRDRPFNRKNLPEPLVGAEDKPKT